MLKQNCEVLITRKNIAQKICGEVLKRDFKEAGGFVERLVVVYLQHFEVERTVAQVVLW